MGLGSGKQWAVSGRGMRTWRTPVFSASCLPLALGFPPGSAHMTVLTLTGGARLQGDSAADPGHPVPAGRFRVSEQHGCLEPGFG